MERARGGRLILSWLWVALLLAAGLPYLALGLIVPPAGQLPMLMAWAFLLGLAIRQAIRRSTRTWIPLLIAVVLWFAVPLIGAELFGWTA